jgi:streptogramin lyase
VSSRARLTGDSEPITGSIDDGLLARANFGSILAAGAYFAGVVMRTGSIALVGALLGYLLFWPVPIDPIPWKPPPSPGFTGPYAKNEALADAQLLAIDGGKGPESVALGSDGYLYSGLRDGRVIRVSSTDADDVRVFANTGGSPGGLAFDALGNLIVCDASQGLLSISPDGGISVLSDHVNGQRLLFLDGLAISKNGTVWFTEASQRWGEGSSAIRTTPTSSSKTGPQAAY